MLLIKLGLIPTVKVITRRSRNHSLMITMNSGTLWGQWKRMPISSERYSSSLQIKFLLGWTLPIQRSKWSFILRYLRISLTYLCSIVMQLKSIYTISQVCQRITFIQMMTSSLQVQWPRITSSMRSISFQLVLSSSTAMMTAINWLEMIKRSAISGVISQTILIN